MHTCTAKAHWDTHTYMLINVILTLLMLETEYSGFGGQYHACWCTGWLPKLPEHYQAWHRLCWTDNMHFCFRVNSFYLGQAKSNILFKIWIYRSLLIFKTIKAICDSIQILTHLVNRMSRSKYSWVFDHFAWLVSFLFKPMKFDEVMDKFNCICWAPPAWAIFSQTVWEVFEISLRDISSPH